MNYGEATSAITIAVDIGHLFKKFFKGFDANILTWRRMMRMKTMN